MKKEAKNHPYFQMKQELFEYMMDEHGVTMVDSEMKEVLNIVEKHHQEAEKLSKEIAPEKFLIEKGYTISAIECHDRSLSQGNINLTSLMQEYAEAYHQQKTEWTDHDIDAAYVMGLMNASRRESTKDDPWPSLTDLRNELDRLIELGYNTPSEAVRALRKPKQQTS